MSKRLQVLLADEELAELTEAARRQGLTTSEWVRRALRDARHREPTADAGSKIERIRRAARHEFPTADIEGMLAEIERGYGPPEAA